MIMAGVTTGAASEAIEAGVEGTGGIGGGTLKSDWLLWACAWLKLQNNPAIARIEANKNGFMSLDIEFWNMDYLDMNRVRLRGTPSENTILAFSAE